VAFALHHAIARIHAATKENNMSEQKNIDTLEPIAKKPTANSTVAPASAIPSVQHDSWLAWSHRIGPTLLVLVLLGGFAYLGHRTGWTMPKFADLFGTRNTANDDWCAEHSVPESICVECDESLLPRPKSTWCRVHGVHNCPFERPELAQMHVTPVVAKEDLERAARALELKDRKENAKNCKQHLRRIQFASDEVVKKMGIDIMPVSREPIFETVSASGEIIASQPLVAPVSAPVAGRVALVTKKGVIGAQVKEGDVLALLDSVEVGKAKTELLQAYAQLELRKRTVDLLSPLDKQGVISASRLMEADLAFREGQIRLQGAQQALNNMGLGIQVNEKEGISVDELSRRVHYFGIPPEIVGGLKAKNTTANLMPVIASRDGTVTAAKVTLGEMAEPGKPLFVVADTSEMWLMLKVRIEDVQYLRVRDAKTNFPGQSVKFRPDGSNKSVEGKLVWKSTDVDDKTRTVQFRAELPNADGSLLANTFGTGQIVIRAEAKTQKDDPAEKDAIVVPTEAVHWEGDCQIVFVRDKNFLDPNGLKVFQVRTVRPGVINGPYTEILAGVLPGEVVATRNSASLRAELLKNNLGAG
jgi:membrane fusion protein, heavy metal efflux system